MAPVLADRPNTPIGPTGHFPRKRGKKTLRQSLLLPRLRGRQPPDLIRGTEGVDFQYDGIVNYSFR